MIKMNNMMINISFKYQGYLIIKNSKVITIVNNNIITNTINYNIKYKTIFNKIIIKIE